MAFCTARFLLACVFGELSNLNVFFSGLTISDSCSDVFASYTSQLGLAIPNALKELWTEVY